MLDLAEKPGIKNEDAKIYCVIPVFNRIQKTLLCISCLKQQSYSNLIILVCDGGSTDGSRDILEKQHPEVIFLADGQERWWGGATRLGVDWALQHSTSSADRILLLNNDVAFGPDYIERVLTHCNSYNAAICGVVVHSERQSEVVDAGVTLDWENYAFKGSYAMPDNGSVVSLTSDVLPGRGTIIPIDAVRTAGSINDAVFPHYLSDYEFSYRLKEKGNIRLGVAFDAKMETSPDGAPPAQKENPFAESLSRFQETRSIRSKRNMTSHLHMIRQHAPPDMKTRLLMKQRIRWFVYVIKPPLEVVTRYSPVWVKYPVKIGFYAMRHPVKAVQKAWARLKNATSQTR